MLCLIGCQQEKTGPTLKELASAEWNSARSRVLVSLANDQYKSGNFDKSRHTVAEAMKLTPDDAGLHLLSAKLAIEGGQLELAEQELKIVRQHAPGDGEAYYLSGVIYQRWQKPETAFEFYQQASAKAPAELAYVLAESEMLVAMDRLPEAMQLLQGKVTYFEHSGAIRDAVGQMLMQARRYPEAMAMFREACILSENDLGVRERFSLALHAVGSYQECSENLSRLLEDKSYARRADLLVLLGDCQLQLGNPRAARITFESATQLDALSARAWQGFGHAALECGDIKRAAGALAHAVALDPTNADSHLLLGYVQLREQHLNDALASFQKANAADAGDTVSLCMMGYVLDKMGRGSDAMQYYTRALKIKPGDEMAAKLITGLDPLDQDE